MRLQESPRASVGGAPIFSENARTNCPYAFEVAESFLDCDANLTASTGRAVTMNELDRAYLFSASARERALHRGKRFFDAWHAFFEIDFKNRTGCLTMRSAAPRLHDAVLFMRW